MAQEYKPKLKEIVKEMGSEINEGIYKSIINIKDFGVSYLKTVGAILSISYFIPYSNKLWKYTKIATDKEISKAEIAGNFFGTITGIVGVLTQLYGIYPLAVKKGHPEILLLPVVTNIASGLYTWQKHVKKEVIKKKSLERTVNN